MESDLRISTAYPRVNIIRMKIMWRTLLPVLALALSLAGCNGAKENGRDRNAATTWGGTAASGVGKVSNPNVKVMAFEEPNEITKAEYKYLKDKYGIEVKYDVTVWEVRKIKKFTAISAGDPYDVLFTTFEEFPTDIIKKVVQPLDKYFDVNDPVFHPVVTDIYSWKYEHYAVSGSKSGPEPVGIWFNKTIFKNSGLKTPLEYYREGQWNFVNFKKLATQLTRDIDKDGKADQYGYASWLYENFSIANGGKFVDYTADGKIDLVWEDEKTVAGMQFLQDGYNKEKYIFPDNNSWMNAFILGQAAMMGERPNWIKNFKEQMKDEFDWAPFPAGPGNTDGTQPGLVSGLAIGGGSKNPEGAAAFIYGECEFLNEKGGNYLPEYYSEEQLKLISEMKLKVKPAMYGGIGDWWNEQWGYWGELQLSGNPLAVIMETWRPRFRANIDRCLADTELPDVEAFSGMPVIDFESGDMGGFAARKGVLTVTSDANEVIGGRNSLKVEAAAGAEWEVIVNTDPAAIKMPSFHRYKVTFDYRMLTDMGDGQCFLVRGRPGATVEEDKDNVGWITVNDKKAGDTGTFEGIFILENDIKDFSLILLVSAPMSFVIDNIAITEST